MIKLTAEAGTELQSIMRDGLLRPRDVLEHARDESSALHPFFTWDDSAAAELRRLDEARRVIVSVRVHVQARPDSPPVQVRAFVSLAKDRIVGRGYRETEVVLSDYDQRAELLRTALQELGALQRKYAVLSELAQVFAAVAQVSKTG
jgi:hypothetical protein